MNISELNGILSKALRHDKRRIKWLSELMQGLYIAKTTNFSKVARVMKGKGKVASRYRRTQRFFNKFDFKEGDCASIIMNLFDWGNQKPYLLMDRTEWEYGDTWVNILVVAVAYKRVAIPLAWKILPGRGNSSAEARMELLESIFAKVGIERFGGLLADREFIGEEWFSDLIKRQLPFYIRVKENADTQNERGKSVQVGWLFHQLKPGEQMELSNRRNLYGHKLKIWGAKSPTNGELMVVVSNEESKNNIEQYLQRWDIETLFGNLKGRGFDFEETRMVSHIKIRRLLFVLTLAYAWAFKIGLFIHQRVKTIPLKNHGRKLHSIFRVGLDFLCEALIGEARTALKVATSLFTIKRPPTLRAAQIKTLRSFVVY
jgi:hypothetical protein